MNNSFIANATVVAIATAHVLFMSYLSFDESSDRHIVCKDGPPWGDPSTCTLTSRYSCDGVWALSVFPSTETLYALQQIIGLHNATMY